MPICYHGNYCWDSWQSISLHLITKHVKAQLILQFVEDVSFCSLYIVLSLCDLNNMFPYFLTDSCYLKYNNIKTEVAEVPETILQGL